MSELHRLFKLALATFVMIAITLPASSQRTMAEELNVVYKPSSKDPDETAILIFSEINQKAAADFDDGLYTTFNSSAAESQR